MSSLGEYHHEEEKETTSHRMIGLIILAVIVLGIGGYVVASGMLNPPAQPVKQYLPL